MVTTLLYDSAPAVLDSAPTVESEWLGRVEDAINTVFEPVNAVATAVIFFKVPVGPLSLPIIVFWLIAAAFIFTFYFGFIQVRGFKLALEVVRGKFSRRDDPGEITHFQALTSALSGTECSRRSLRSCDRCDVGHPVAGIGSPSSELSS
jgi:hypothetical protein